MSRREADKQQATRPARGANPRRRTHAELLKLQLAIVSDRDFHGMTWAAIAQKHKLGEKEARETYARYINEIAPLIEAAGPREQLHEYLRACEAVRQRLLEVADNADNDSARVGALREYMNTLSKEIELRQHAGLMPKRSSDADVRAEDELRAQRVEELLVRNGVPPEVCEELAALFDDESER